MAQKTINIFHKTYSAVVGFAVGVLAVVLLVVVVVVVVCVVIADAENIQYLSQDNFKSQKTSDSFYNARMGSQKIHTRTHPNS